MMTVVLIFVVAYYLMEMLPEYRKLIAAIALLLTILGAAWFRV